MVEYRSKDDRVYPVRGKFIAGAVEHPGSLRKYLKDTYGVKAFDKEGRIKVDWLQALAKGRCPEHTGKCSHPSLTTRRRAQLALTLRRLGK